jgi:hypothetical protein
VSSSGQYRALGLEVSEHARSLREAVEARARVMLTDAVRAVLSDARRGGVELPEGFEDRMASAAGPTLLARTGRGRTPLDPDRPLGRAPRARDELRPPATPTLPLPVPRGPSR